MQAGREICMPLNTCSRLESRASTERGDTSITATSVYCLLQALLVGYCIKSVAATSAFNEEAGARITPDSVFSFVSTAARLETRQNSQGTPAGRSLYQELSPALSNLTAF
ncbi:hypothetical protein RRG08_048269 [Elysia crispata]|uniref:Uncharacterized protein n=1 Tax=Elysia crispata TaxID=231223 RepID=A0AAE0ZSZ7_9GAST|nr:hypothetical protein RRG08_048269 [Elysia crispata]